MKVTGRRSLALAIATVTAVLLSLGSCEAPLSPDDVTDDPNGFTEGSRIPPLSIIEGTIELSDMIVFELLDWPEDQELPDGVEIVFDGDETSGTMTITLDNYPRDPEPPQPVVNGEVIVEYEFDGLEEIGTLVVNGEVAVTGHPPFTEAEVIFIDTTWIMPLEEGDEEDDTDPLRVEVSGSIVFNNVEYQMRDILRAVQSAVILDRFVGQTILPIAHGFYESHEEWVDPENVEVEWVDDESGPISITFTAFDPTGEGLGFTITGIIVVDIDGDPEEGLVDVSFDGSVTAENFPFATVSLDPLVASWESGIVGDADSLAGSMTLDGFTYPGDYLMEILALFDDEEE